MKGRLWVLGWPPFPHDAAENTPQERRWWLLMLVSAWVIMGGAVIASSAIITDLSFLAMLAGVLVLAFPVARYLHFSRLPRFYVNYATLLVAVVLGYVVMRAGWPPGGADDDITRLIVSYRTLVCLFYWVMVFRAFAVRTVVDLAQSAIPAASGLLLILLSEPQPVAILGAVAVLLGTLAVLSGEQAQRRSERTDAVVSAAKVRGGRWRPALNSWLGLSLATLLAGTGVALVAARLEPTNETSRWLRRELAWRLAQYMIDDRGMIMHDPTLLLGGPSPRTRNRPVLTLAGEEAMKVRTGCYETYDGRSWSSDRRKWHKIEGHGKWVLPPPESVGLSSRASSESTPVTLTAHRAFGRHLPVPWYPLQVEANFNSLRQDYTGSVIFGGWLAPGQSYRALIAMPDTLQPVVAPDQLPRVGVEPALQLPDSLPDRVRELAREVTTGITTPREMAIAIEGYLATEYPYSLQAPQLPPGADFVDHFLFEGKVGYCTHFASAMVVLLRAVGVPARMAVGYTSGEFEAEKQAYVIREQDAHTWVEVYLPGTGWVDFDPTPLQSAEEHSLTALLGEVPHTIALGVRAAWNWLLSNATFVAGVLAAVALLALMWVVAPRWWWRRIRRLPAGAEPGARVRHAYAQALRWLERSGVPRPATAAPWEFHAAATAQLPALAQDLTVLTAKYVSARYSAHPATEEDWSAAEGALLRLREGLFGRSRP